MTPAASLRAIEAPLTAAEVAERPTLDAVSEMWAEALKVPVPMADYDAALRRFLRLRRR